MDLSDASDFKLGDWWVRPQRNELERTGETARVEARSMDVLVCLGRHAPGVVDKERLLAEVWQGAFGVVLTDDFAAEHAAQRACEPVDRDIVGQRVATQRRERIDRQASIRDAGMRRDP